MTHIWAQATIAPFRGSWGILFRITDQHQVAYVWAKVKWRTSSLYFWTRPADTFRSPARVERWPSAGTRAVAKALEVGNEMQKERNLSHGCASLYI